MRASLASLPSYAERPTPRRFALTLDDRLENWARCYRVRKRFSQAESFEGNYRSRQSEHWEYGKAPPVTPPDLDVVDGEIIDLAWQSMPDAFHQCLLGAWYVRRWSPRKCLQTARDLVGYEHRRTDDDIEPYLAMARLLLAEQLDIPAVIRRTRLVRRTREALGLETWE